MKKEKDNTVQIGLTIMIFFGVLIFFLSYKPTIDSKDYVKDLYYPQRTMVAYDVVSYKKVQDPSGPLTQYTGKAMNCDTLGNCESIEFVSEKEPKIGRANFVPWYSTMGEVSGWVLVKNNSN